MTVATEKPKRAPRKKKAIEPTAPAAPERSIHEPFRLEVVGDFGAWWALETHRRRVRRKLILGNPDPKVRSKMIAVERALCRRDPIHLIEQWGWMENPDEVENPHLRMVPAVLWPKQHELVRFLLEGLKRGRNRLIAKTRKFGVSWLVCFLAVHGAMFGRGFKVKFGSRKQELVDGDPDSLFAKIRFIVRTLPLFLLESRPRSKSLGLTFSRGSAITGESTNKGFSRGGRRAWTFIDEAAHIETNDQPAIIRSCMSAQRSLVLVSSVNGPGNKFAELYRTMPKEDVFVVDWRADPRNPPDFKAQRIAAGDDEEDFEQEFECKLTRPRTGRIFNARTSIVEYDEFTPEFLALGKRGRVPVMASWDFGSGPSRLVCLWVLVEMLPEPRLWFDSEQHWRQTAAKFVSADVKKHATDTGYGGLGIHLGDPAGKQRDANQSSWFLSLRSFGIPIFGLPPIHNTRDGIEANIRLGQTMLNEGRIRIHRRCSYLWECLKNWARSVPEGVNPDFLDRDYIKPQGGDFSHGGMAFTYAAPGILSAIEAERAGRGAAAAEMDDSPGGAILDALAGRFGGEDEEL